jgi:hypothetical protein
VRLFAAACVSLLLLIEHAPAADPKPIEEIRILKVGVNTSLDEFLKLHPTAYKAKKDQVGVASYLVRMEKGCSALFMFLNGELAGMEIGWLESEGADAQECKEQVEHMIAKYGKPTTILESKKGEPSETKCLWVNEATNNFMGLVITKGELRISYMDYKRSGKLKPLLTK